jgi:hypothetical protein
MAKIFKSKEHGYVLELWGASTKHPDSIFFFDEFKKNDLFDDEQQVFQWLLECASKLTWPMHAKYLVDEDMIWYPFSVSNWTPPELEEWSHDHWHPNYR